MKKKRLLKSLSQDLLLEPLGFVVLSDTIVATEMSKTGQEFSGSLIIDSALFWDSISYQKGQETQVERIGKSGDITADVAELRARLTAPEHLKRLLFLPLPKEDSTEVIQQLEQTLALEVEVLDSKHVVEKAIQLGGKEVLTGAISHDLNNDKTRTESESRETLEETHVAVPSAAKSDSPLLNAPPPGFGVPTFAQEKTNDESSLEPSPELGFVINNKTPQIEGEEVDSISETNLEEIDRETSLMQHSKTAPGIPFWKKILAALPVAALSTKRKQMVPLVIGAVVLILGGSLGTFFFLRGAYAAQVTLWLAPTEIEATQQFFVGAGEIPAASEGAVLDASVFLENVTLDKEVPTTGIKIIGEKAKGTVTLFNKTLQEKEFAAGTIITTQGISFALDNTVKIASATSTTRVTEHGSAQVAVTAVKIGPGSNIDKKQVFTVANFDSSSYAAENDEAFSGGAEREIQAIAKSDVDKAAQELAEAGKTQIADKIRTLGNENEVVLFTDQTQIKEVKTSAEVGTEAKFVSVTVVVEGVGIRIPQSVLEETAQKLLSQQENTNTILPESVAFTPENITQLPDGRYQITAKVTAKTMPQLTASEIQAELPGVYIERIKNELPQDGRIKRVDIQLTPKGIGSLFTRLPQNPEKIQLNIRLDQSN